MKYRMKPVHVEVLTFDELVAAGLATCANIVNGMPWAFTLRGKAISHENDQCYLIPGPDGKTLKMTPADWLMISESDQMMVAPPWMVLAVYEVAND